MDLLSPAPKPYAPFSLGVFGGLLVSPAFWASFLVLIQSAKFLLDGILLAASFWIPAGFLWLIPTVLYLKRPRVFAAARDFLRRHRRRRSVREAASESEASHGGHASCSTAEFAATAAKREATQPAGESPLPPVVAPPVIRSEVELLVFGFFVGFIGTSVLVHAWWVLGNLAIAGGFSSGWRAQLLGLAKGWIPFSAVCFVAACLYIDYTRNYSGGASQE